MQTDRVTRHPVGMNSRVIEISARLKKRQEQEDIAKWARILDHPPTPKPVMVEVCRDADARHWQKIDGLQAIKRVIDHRKGRTQR